MNNLRFYFIEKQFKRGTYLFRQGELINGVFCILEGEARLIKEMWTLAKEDDDEKKPEKNQQRAKKSGEQANF